MVRMGNDRASAAVHDTRTHPPCFRKRGCKALKTKSGGMQTRKKRLQPIDSKGHSILKKCQERERGFSLQQINDLGLFARDVEQGNGLKNRDNQRKARSYLRT